LEILKPLIYGLILASVGGLINHLYWKKRFEIGRKIKKYEESISIYIKLCEKLLEFNACTDMIMRLKEEKGRLQKKRNKENADNERLKEIPQYIQDYEIKRIDALKGLSQGINYAKIFFESAEVETKVKAYLDLYEKIRINEIEWDETAFDKIFNSGKELQSSMEAELINERDRFKRRWYQCGKANR
jgi:hypothetical protein